MSPEVEVDRRGEGVLLRAMRGVLRPIARILLAQRVGFRQASELLKQAYVDAALDAVDDEQEEISTSRLSMFTGIHRKEVKRLRESPAGNAEVPRSVAQGAPILEAWTHDPRFSDDDGRPRPLHRNLRARGDVSFDDLVRAVTSDVHPRTVLDEWLRLGLVAEEPDGRIALLRAAFVPTEGQREKLFYFERNLRDHLDVAAANLESAKEPMFERSLQVSDLSPEAIRELEHLAMREGMRALETVHKRARELRGAVNEATSGKGDRINFGLYFLRPRSARSEESSHG